MPPAQLGRFTQEAVSRRFLRLGEGMLPRRFTYYSARAWLMRYDISYTILDRYCPQESPFDDDAHLLSERYFSAFVTTIPSIVDFTTSRASRGWR